MKKISILLIFIIALSFCTSCSDIDDTDLEYENMELSNERLRWGNITYTPIYTTTKDDISNQIGIINKDPKYKVYELSSSYPQAYLVVHYDSWVSEYIVFVAEGVYDKKIT